MEIVAQRVGSLRLTDDLRFFQGRPKARFHGVISLFRKGTPGRCTRETGPHYCMLATFRRFSGPFGACNCHFCREKALFRACALIEKHILRVYGGRSSIGSLGTVSDFETALLGGAAEKPGLSISYSPPIGESQAPSEMHKWPFMPPNGPIHKELCCKERYLMTA